MRSSASCRRPLDFTSARCAKTKKSARGYTRTVPTATPLKPWAETDTVGSRTMDRNLKQQRQRLIREIIATGGVRTQDELAERLAARGTPVTQATISRDLVELGAVRVPVAGQGLVYALPEDMGGVQAEAARRRLRLVLSEVPGELGVASTILVFRTSPGLANMVAITLDACQYPEIVGTVAGDDTIFIALRDPADRPAVEAILLNKD